MKKDNPYLFQVWKVLPRLLALYDTDNYSPTFGVGDRYRWAWRLIDFGNGTFQGAANGLARLLKKELLPSEISEKSILNRIDSMFRGTKTICFSNGSLAESFPYESSFCVTALVAYDLLSAIDFLDNKLDDQKRNSYFEIVEPMIKFLNKNDETHAFISNHLAVAAAALYKWNKLITDNKSEGKGEQLLKRILFEQSEEGWFREYEGADPGYQSLCTYYLADIHKIRPDLGLLETLRRSIQFLWHFAHPDGSFGGYYGSRNTRFYCPAGIEALSEEISEAAALANFMRSSINKQTTVTLEVMDEPNLIPMFNSYCLAAEMLENNKTISDDMNLPNIPALENSKWRRNFKEAGLCINKDLSSYTIVSWHKGGVYYHFPFEKKEADINTGVVVRDKKAKYYSTQSYNLQNKVEFKNESLTITAQLMEVNNKLPTPLQFLILRFLNITFMRIPFVSKLIKKMLVNRLIKMKKRVPLNNVRKIELGKGIVVEDELDGRTKNYIVLDRNTHFSAIRMASQGYWQRQDDSTI